MKNTLEKSTTICSFSGYTPDSVRYGLFDRHNGVSEGLFSSCNIGLGVGDNPELVIENRDRVRRELGVDYLLSGRQTHGDSIFILEEPLNEDLEVDDYDAFITRQRNVGLVIQHADCQAILLYDPEHEAIGAVHSGWRGSVINLLEKTVSEMTRVFSTHPAQLRVVISPSLGPCCAEFVNFKQELPPSFHEHMVADNHFDFWQISKQQLMTCGVKEHSVTIPTICTSCSSDYFSYRRACRDGSGVTGRNCSVIALPGN
ncbi:peptidoglycan editing factor PgeF [Desulfosediminicola flagellatus]|uniref:peptidoglycan editing factor PgeF n=1 Tax=Desulfosediminicola flagellatus TaxID=2569541 RepID=UPI00142EF56F|nr:peptidoglycan editing factor PgeF [Desulfosediminicola flagellatus]